MDGELLDLLEGAPFGQEARERRTAAGQQRGKVGLHVGRDAVGHLRPQRRLERRLQLPPQGEDARLPLPGGVDAGETPVVQLVAGVQRQVDVVADEGVVADVDPDREIGHGMDRLDEVVEEVSAERAPGAGERSVEVAGVGHAGVLSPIRRRETRRLVSPMLRSVGRVWPMQRSTDGMRSGEPAAGGLAAGGLAAGGLARMHEVLAGHVERGSMPGLVALVAHGGDVHVDVIGAKAFGDPQPLRHDDLFRIASLTKPITAVAAMTLVEDGTLDLEAPVDDLLPELADRRVLRSLDAELDDTVPAERSITVEDLLTFTMGFGTVMAPSGHLSRPGRGRRAGAPDPRAAVAADPAHSGPVDTQLRHPAPHGSTG